MTYTTLMGTTHYDTLDEMTEALEALDALKPIGRVLLYKGQSLLASTGIDWTGPISISATRFDVVFKLGDGGYIVDREQFRGATCFREGDVVRLAVKLTQGVLLRVTLGLGAEDENA